MLLQCRPENHSLYHILTRYNINIENQKVLFIGSHDLIEYETLNKFNPLRVDCFEANKYVYPDLLTRIRNDSRYNPHFICLSNKDNEDKEFFVYQDKKNGASGLYKPDRMSNHVDCPITGESWFVKSMTYDTYSEDVELPEDYYLAIVDVQGSELDILNKANSLLRQLSLKYIICETSSFNCYENGPIDTDITKFLEKNNFIKYGYWKDWGNDKEWHGDTIYKRNE